MQAFGCGQCLPCRINKRREWTHRIMLEAMQYGDNAFVTLTYREDEQLSLEPDHARNFLKRIRKHFEPRKLRFYLVGEYGDQSGRPHYHLALFNYPTCSYGLTQYNRNGIKCCDTCKGIQSLWGFGNVYLGALEPSTAAYIAGYVTKKMTRTDDVRLGNRHPEFARMSLRPGIGYSAMHELASVHLQYLSEASDVTPLLRHANKKMPLGRYLTRSLRALTGRGMNAPLETIQKAQEEMQTLRDSTWDLPPHSKRKEIFKKMILDKYKGNVVNMEAKYKLYGKKKGSI